MTATTVRVANEADVTGPIPGLFSSSQNAAKAFVAYFNSTGQTICGRTLELETMDSQTSETGDHDASTAACAKDFAMVGSTSAFDAGGASVVQKCGIPDVRAAMTTGARAGVPNVFGSLSSVETAYASPTANYFKSTYGDTVLQHAAYVYINAGASSEQAPLQKKAWESDGYHFDYVAAVDITDFNYAPFVQAMKSKGIQLVLTLMAESQSANFVKAVKSQGFQPKAVLVSSNSYDATFPQEAGGAATGAYAFIPGRLFTEGGTNPETQLYEQWLARVAPSDAPSFFGMFSWSAMRLFVQEAQAVGPNLTRSALINRIKTVKDWTSNGMHAPQQVGPKITGQCESLIQWNGSAWVRVTPAPWSCGPLLSSGA